MHVNLKAQTRKLIDPALNAWWDFRCTERYWRLRNIVGVVNFYVRRWAFNTQLQVEQTTTAASDSWAIIRGAISSLLWAVLLFFVLTGAEDIFRNYLPSVHGWSIKATNWLAQLFSSELKMNEEMYANLLGGVASVSGVFLGLYFTAISIGVGQQLGVLSPRVRHLIVTERKGSLYIKLLTTLTSLSFLLWANAATLGNTSYPAVLFIVVFSLFVVSAFYPLGLQSFFMADPNSIAIPVFQSIYGTLRRMHTRSLHSTHPSFDKYYRTKTISDLHLLQEIGNLALSTQRRDHAQLSVLLGNLYNQVLYYVDFKHSVESSSQWYSRTRLHDDLLMMDDVKGRMLEQFGHIPDPKEEPDPNWLEDAALTFTESILKDLHSRKDIDGFIELLPTIRAFVGHLANRWEVDLALATYRLLKKYAEPVYNDSSLQFTTRLHLAEGTAILQIDIIQQCLQRVVSPKISEEVELLTDSVFRKRPSRLGLVLPAVKSQIENLRTRLSIEKQIEGSLFTPRWYVSQLIAKSYAEQVNILFDKLAAIPEVPKFDKEKASTYEDAAILIFITQYALQAATRLSGHEHYYSSFTAGLKAFEKIPDLPIGPFKDGANTANFNKTSGKAFDLLGDLLLPVFKEKRDKNLPDFFGLAYYQLANELFRLLKDNEHARFSALYPKVLAAAFFARERIMEEYGHLEDMTKVRFALEPIYDLMTIGSYAAFFSEIHSNRAFYDTTISAWSKVLKLLNVKADKCEWLLAIYGIMRGDFRIISRASIRFYWEQQFREILEEQHFISRDRFSWREEENNGPTTPWLKALCRGGREPHDNLCEVFLAIFLPALGASDNAMAKLKSRFFDEIKEKGDTDEIP